MLHSKIRKLTLYILLSIFPPNCFPKRLCQLIIFIFSFICTFYSCFLSFRFLFNFCLFTVVLNLDLSSVSSSLSPSCFKYSRVSFKQLVFPIVFIMIFNIRFESLSSFILSKCPQNNNLLFLVMSVIVSVFLKLLSRALNQHPVFMNSPLHFSKNHLLFLKFVDFGYTIKIQQFLLHIKPLTKQMYQIGEVWYSQRLTFCLMANWPCKSASLLQFHASFFAGNGV